MIIRNKKLTVTNAFPYFKASNCSKNVHKISEKIFTSFVVINLFIKQIIDFINIKMRRFKKIKRENILRYSISFNFFEGGSSYKKGVRGDETIFAQKVTSLNYFFHTLYILVTKSEKILPKSKLKRKLFQFA